MDKKGKKPAIRFRGFTDDWEQRKLSEVSEKICVGFVGTCEKYYTDESGIPMYRTGNLKGLTLNHDDLKYVTLEFHEKNQKSQLRKGDILIARHGDSGKAVTYELSEEANCLNIVIIRPDMYQCNHRFLASCINSPSVSTYIKSLSAGSTQTVVNTSEIEKVYVKLPVSIDEQNKIADFLTRLDETITLHQRECIIIGGNIMLEQSKDNDLFCDYYAQWVHIYKEGAIRKVTLDKYRMTQKWLTKLIPKVRLCDMTRIIYQNLLNEYATTHERQTTMDFHHQLKGAILDAVDEGLIGRDPTRKVIIKGKQPSEKKIKYLNQFELHTLLSNLDLKKEINWDWFILLVAKTGMRFSEALALTPKDFDFPHQTLSINKTWDYKGDGGFLPTKNKSSIRKIQIDWQTVVQFSELIKNASEDEPIFVKKEKIYNSTVNAILERHCKKNKIPTISVHGLRHTHASLLLFAGVSIGSVARRLGHASMTTTQKTYLHIIHELENQDVELVMRSLSSLN